MSATSKRNMRQEAELFLLFFHLFFRHILEKYPVHSSHLGNLSFDKNKAVPLFRQE